jgi:putative addiction module CopG family antidote
MRTTRQVSVTLPTEMADAIKQRVASGDYASESEVVRDGLRALLARERAIERWLSTDVVAAYDDMKAHPERGVPADAARARFAAKRKPRT